MSSETGVISITSEKGVAYLSSEKGVVYHQRKASHIFSLIEYHDKKCLVKHKKHVQIDHGGFIEIIARVQFVVSWLLRLIAAPYVRMVGQEHQARPELVRTF